MVNVIRFLILLFAAFLVFPQKAHAYADPGSGALLYQMAYAAFLAGTFFLRKLLNRVTGRRKQ